LAGLQDPLALLALVGVPFVIFEAVCSSAGSVVRATILEHSRDIRVESIWRAAPSSSGQQTRL